MYLGDYGAEVIKIEHPQGDGLRVWGAVKDGAGLYFKMLNRNKRAITADLHTPLGVEIVRRLVAGADAMIENFRPGTLEKWGLGYDALAAREPGARAHARDRLRPDRSGARSARLRHHRGGGHRLRGHQRRGRRPAAPAELRAGGLRRRARRRLPDPGRAAGARAARRARPGRGPGHLRAPAHPDGPAAHRVRSARHRAGAHRQPHAADRPAQHLPGARRQVDRALRRVAVGVRAALPEPRRARAAGAIRASADNQARLAHVDALDAALQAAIARVDQADLLARLDAAQAVAAPVRGADEVLADPHYRRAAPSPRWRMPTWGRCGCRT